MITHPKKKEIPIMKKTLACIAVLGALSPLAQAQSSVTIYGIVDAGLSKESGGAVSQPVKVSSGIGSASRIGFRGTEDLGGGLSALFLLETGVRIDTGEIDAAGTIFNRQAYVGIKSATAGQLSLGRQYTPYYLAFSAVGDPFAAGYAGSAKNLFPTAGVTTRGSNSIYYVSPKFAGAVTGELYYALAEQAGSSVAGRQIGAAIGYSAGKLNARLAHNHRNNDLTAAAGAAQVPPVPAANRGIGRNTLLAANYDFGVAKGYAMYGVDKGLNSAVLPNTGNPFGGVKATASLDSRDLLIGATIPAGNNTILASYIRKDDKTAFNQDASQLAVGLQHALSKRTSLYTTYGKIKNRRGAGYTVGNNSEVGTGDTAYNAGIRHTF
jgi:general bacterial porin, GBP family